jgi:ABC-type sugar transport system ATPase subunit
MRVVLLDEPTHGIDVGAKEEIYKVIRGIAQEGVGVVLISSEFEELEALCTRTLLLHEGALVGELKGDEIDQARILSILFDQREAA